MSKLGKASRAGTARFAHFLLPKAAFVGLRPIAI